MVMENKESLSANDSLKLIESMIHKAQNRFSENGTLYLLWGWTIFFCALVQYISLKYTSFSKASFVWLLVVFVMIYQIFYLSKKQQTEKVKTYTDEIIGYVWMSFGICMGLLSFIMSKLDVWILFYPFIFLFYGIPTFLSGAIMRFKPLMIGGICCWALSVAASFITSVEVILLLVPAVLFGWIIPGYLLRARFKSA
ncbi:MAG: hypothetical protein EAZ12_03275 [Sphingobacteriia bacterium]|nr:MAG: hypothetical protein EAZ12_03275 [Sphingobacteriia bacterium]